MSIPPLSELVPVLQIAVGPVILISGVGLLLLSLTNRLGRAIDRARILRGEWSLADPLTQKRTVAQLHILWQRADIIRKSIFLASLSLLLAACLIITLFVEALLGWNAGGLLVGLFVGCLASLIGSLVLFMYDINRSLAALRLELQEALEQEMP